MRRTKLARSFSTACLMVVVFCGAAGCREKKGAAPMAMTLVSSAFEHGKPILKKHTADGANVSPPLTWSNAPDGTESFVLICDDADAPGGEPWVHWVVYNIPGAASSLSEAVPPIEEVDSIPSGQMGSNSWPTVGWRGPAPPSGTHRYFFRLYALDTRLELPGGADKRTVLDAAEGHVLATAELMGTYAR